MHDLTEQINKTKRINKLQQCCYWCLTNRHEYHITKIIFAQLTSLGLAVKLVVVPLFIIKDLWHCASRSTFNWFRCRGLYWMVCFLLFSFSIIHWLLYLCDGYITHITRTEVNTLASRPFSNTENTYYYAKINAIIKWKVNAGNLRPPISHFIFCFHFVFCFAEGIYNNSFYL